jgi:hypothetical protein
MNIRLYPADNDEIFQYNYGVALAANNQFVEAEEALLLVQSPEYVHEYTYLR